MNSTNLLYLNGHFYNKATGKRMIFNEGAEFLVVCEKDYFAEAGPAGRYFDKTLSSEELLAKITKSSDKREFHKILDKGCILFFEIGFDKENYLFKAELMEDLYAYRPKGNNKEFTLYDCHCFALECGNPKIIFPEMVYGKSISDLYKCTYIHYFGNKGNPSSNAITTFTLEDRKTTLDDLRKRLKKIER